MVNISAFAFQLSTRRRFLQCYRQASPSLFMKNSSISRTAIATPRISTTTLPNDDEQGTSTRPQPLHILGAGSMGLLFATLIRQQLPSYPLQLLLTPRHASKLQNVGRRGPTTTKKHVVTVSIQESFRDESNNNNKRSRPSSPRLVEIPARLITEFQDPECKYTISNLLVTTKAFQAKAAIESIQHCFSCYNNNINNMQEQDDDDDDAQCPSTRIILLCNGAIALEDELRKHFDNFGIRNNDKDRCPAVYLGWTTNGAQRIHSGNDVENDDDMFHLIHAGFGRTAIQDCPDLAQVFSINCESVSSDTIRQQLWTKLAANCVINTFTAIKGCKNGDLIQHLENKTEMSNTMRQVIEEVVRVAQAEDQGGGEPLSVEAVSDFCRQVMVDTAENQSSMLVDVLARRPTEIEYLSGYVAQKGRALGISCPANELLCRQVQELTKGYT